MKLNIAAAAGEVAPSPEEVFEVFEFRITLRGIKPMIWRRIQVPKDDFTFEALHSAIQGAMGWHGFHLYNFRVRDQHGAFVQIADENGADEWLRTLVTILPADETNISDYFRVKGNYANYLYDFGDGWQHKVTLSKIVRGNPNESYPKVLAGKRACPPEGELQTTRFFRSITHYSNSLIHSS